MKIFVKFVMMKLMGLYALHLPNNCLSFYMGFPGGSDGKESACSVDLGSVSGLGRSPRKGNDNLLQYSCLENSMDRGAWRATVMEWQRVGQD